MSYKDKLKDFIPIAIVGMGGLFPGAANLTEFWENILNGKDAIQDVPPDFWDIDAFYDPDPFAPDKTYCRRGGFIPEVEFDAMEFGIPPKNLEAISLNQLLALKIAQATLLDAGMIGPTPVAYDKEKVGVILGSGVGGNAFFLRERLVGLQHFEKALIHLGMSRENVDKVIRYMKDTNIEWQENSFPGYLPNIVASRIANRFDFGGVSYSVDAACSSSLCAMVQSIYELQTGNCDIVLTGGVSLLSDPAAFLSFSKTPALSLKNQIRPFDKDADGMLLGDAIGMLVFKRLEDAEKSGDKIYAVIRGMGSSSDGRAKSIYAPRLEGQVNVLKRAYESGNVNPVHIGYIEGHGTGTVVGDLCEIKALKAFFGEHGLEPQSIGLGSVKSQIGHTILAAGAASTIKTALSLHHKLIPPMINVNEPHPEFDIDCSPFYISTKTRPWISKKGQKRMAGVSSFGFGGVNFHLILEEYQKEQRSPYRINRLPRSIVVSAAGSDALLSRCLEMKAALEQTDDSALPGILSRYNSPQVQPDQPRLGLVVMDRTSALEKMEKGIERLKNAANQDWNHPAGIFHRQKSLDKNTGVAALFSSQGSQYPDMGVEIARDYPEMREAFRAADQIFLEEREVALSDIVFPKPCFTPEKEAANARRLTETRNAQPALAAFCSGLYQILNNRGLKPDIMIGHSFGELTALWAAGVVDTATFYRMSTMRGLFMQKSAEMKGDHGTMLAVKNPPKNLETIISEFKDVNISNYNSPSQVVVSGATESIRRLGEKLAGIGVAAQELNVSCAFHSPFMVQARDAFRAVLKAIPFRRPAIPVYNNLTGRPYPDDTGGYAELLSEQLLNPILFSQSIDAAYKAGCRVFIEIGPKLVLSAFVQDILKDKPVEIVSIIQGNRKSSEDQLTEAITRLRVLGMELTDDPYRMEMVMPERKTSKRLPVILKGQQYLTPETKKRFKNAGEKPIFQISVPNIHEKQDLIIPENHTTVSAEKREGKSMSIETVQNIMPLQSAASDDSRHGDDVLEAIVHNQAANSRLQEIFLNNQTREIELIEKLANKQHELLRTNGNAEHLKEIAAMNARHLEFIRKAHDDFSNTHLTYLNHQQMLLSQMTGRKGQQGLQPTDFQPAPSFRKEISPSVSLSQDVQDLTAAQPAPAENGSADNNTSASSIAASLLAIVAETTGYPVDMLELSMNIEADLGIDSIKRVEIFSALHEEMPQLLENIDLSDVGEIHTLGDVIEFLTAAEKRSRAAADVIAVPAESSAVSGGSAPVIHPKSNVVADVLLRIIAETTGYPVDMLELSMNIEADLGIDSIKRVEIFSALHEEMPQLLENIDLSDLGEIHTLGDVIEFLNKCAEKPASPDTTQTPAPPVVQHPECVSARYTVHAETIRLPEMSRLDITPGHQILITEDGSGTGIALKSSLKTMGHAVTLIEFGDHPAPLKDDVDLTIGPDQMNDEAIGVLLHDLASKKGPIGGFVHIAPIQEELTHPGGYVDERESKILKTVFFMAKYLKKPLSEAGKKGRSIFVTVTRIDGQMGLNGSRPRSIIQGGYYGLVKSLKQEAPQVFCRCIDIAPELRPDATALLITEELYDRSELPLEIGRASKETRYTIGKVESCLKGKENADLCPNRDSVFIVAGGGRGVTARCVEGLAEKFKSRFILIGRTDIEKEEPPWSVGYEDEEKLKHALIDQMSSGGVKPTPTAVNRELKKILSQREIRRTLNTIHSHGGKAVYIKADITKTKDVQAKLKAVLKDFGPVTGIIHGAGNLADKNLEKKCETDYDTVFDTKIIGLKTLLECVEASAIRHLILFSSISGYYGKDGQADYALSNEILNKFSHAFSKFHPGTFIRSINWGPWDGGMVSEHLKQWYRKLNIDIMPVKEGVDFLLDEISHGAAAHPQIVICPRSLENLVRQAKESLASKDNVFPATN